MEKERIEEIQRLLESLERTNFVAGFDGWVKLVHECLSGVEDLRGRLADYENAWEDHKRLTRELDVIWNGEAGAAKQASLCDMVGQIEKELPPMRSALPSSSVAGEGEVMVSAEEWAAAEVVLRDWNSGRKEEQMHAPFFARNALRATKGAP